MKNQLYNEQGWLLLLLALPLIFLFFWRYQRQRQPVLTVTTLISLEEKHYSTISPPVLFLTLRLLTLFFMIMALTNFRLMTTISHKKPVAGADIILAVDVSKSMLIEDMKPNRLEVLKKVLSEFIAGRKNDKIGIVLYAGESLYWCPLTTDRSFLLKRLNQLNELNFSDGTAIGIGLASAVNALHASKNQNKVVILLTDGENNTGYIAPLTATQLAKKFNIKVYTIGIGKTGISQFPVFDSNGQKRYVKLDVSIDEPMLKSIATATSALYFNATDGRGLQRIYSRIDHLEKSVNTTIQEVKYKDLYQVFAITALFFLLLEIILKFTFFRTWP